MAASFLEGTGVSKSFGGLRVLNEVGFRVAEGEIGVREKSRGLEARGRFADHQSAFRDAQSFLDDRNNRSRPQLDANLARLRGIIARYGVPDDPAAGESWLASAPVRRLPEKDRERVKGDMAEVFYLMAGTAYLKARAVALLRRRDVRARAPRGHPDQGPTPRCAHRGGPTQPRDP